MNLFKVLLDALSPKTPSQKTQRDDQEKFLDNQRKLDRSLDSLKIASDDYAGVVTRLVTQVMIDVKNERRDRNNEKTSSRSGKT